MIAARSVSQSTRIPNPRTVAGATHRRVSRASRARFATLVRICAVLFGVLVLLMSYVVLTSSLTGLSYAVGRAEAKREALQEETIRLDDRLSALRSNDRLEALAARLGFREPERIALVHVPAPQVTHVVGHFPVLSSLAGFFIPAIAAKP